MKEQVLFIDDDMVLLDGLKRMLRHMRNEWDISFCSSGEAALDIMRQRCFDVVVSDMRMPGLDGAAVLTAVRELCPNSVRIVLSGQAEFETVLRALVPAHQYIAKPCSPEKLKFILKKSFDSRRFMGCEVLSSFVSNLEKIPGDIEVYERFRSELSKSNVAIEEIARIGSSDISLSLKLLQLANSGFFGSRPAVLEPAAAVVNLGVGLLRRLVLETEIFGDHHMSVDLQDEIRIMNRHALAVANMSREIATLECEDLQFVDACFTAGLLHDVGKIVLAAFAPNRYTKAFRQSLETPVLLEDEERRVFGASHSEVGSYLMALWGLPEPIVECAAHHHAPATQLPRAFGVTSIVHVTNALQDCIESSEFMHALQAALPRYLDRDYLQQVQGEGRFSSWLSVFQSAIPAHDLGLR